MSITSITMRGGESPWVNAVVEWTGVSATWTLIDTTTSATLYVGPGLRYDMDTLPETVYHLQLSDDSGTSQRFSYVAPPLSTPVSVVATDITATTAVMNWMRLAEVSLYEVAVDETSYPVTPIPPPEPPEQPAQPSLLLSDLEPDRTYAAKVRAFMDTSTSLWSPTMYFTTDRLAPIEASEYEYEPFLARTWTAAGWLMDGQPLIHGSGELFGDTSGINTTVFWYSTDVLDRLHELVGVRVLTAAISITRFAEASDPRMVLSHWLLHNMTNPPAGAPTFVGEAMGVDSGSVPLGQQAWMTLPTGWIDAMINREACGFGWGGVVDRYMRAQPLNDPANVVSPVNGTLRISVG